MGSTGDDTRPNVSRWRWLPWAALALTLAISFLWKSRCLDQAAWSEGIQYRLYCYSDVVALWFTRGFAEGLIPYVDEALEYPTLIGAQIGVIAAVVGRLGGGVAWFFSLNAVVNAAAAAGILFLLHRQGLSRFRSLGWAAAPPLGLYAFHNWDLPALALLVWAITLHREGRDTRAGLAAGLGAAAKLLPIFVVPLFVLARLRQGEIRQAANVAGAAVLAWAAANVPVAVAAPEEWRRFFEFSSERGVTSATIWAALHRWGVLEAEVTTVNTLSALAFAVGGALILLVGLRRYEPATTWMLLLPLFAWFLLTNKVYSPQFDLWLIPLLVLAHRRAQLGWFFVASGVVLFAELGFLGDRLPYAVVAAALTLRAGILGWIVVGSLRGCDAHRQEPSHILASADSAGSGRPNHTGAK